MAFFDMSLPELESYNPARTEPADFDDFWARTLADTRAHALNATFTPVDYGLSQLETYDVVYAGYGGQPVHGWLNIPRHRSGPLPAVVQYLGYGGGRGIPVNWLEFASAGYAHFVMDTRGQGSAWLQGDTPDPELEGGNPQHPGFMTRGILKPETYYYRRVFTDAVRAVEAVRSHADVDAARVAVTGGSQGGGISLAVAALLPDLQMVMPDVPFLCHYRRATQIVDSLPYNEISRYLKVHRSRIEQVFANLAYFDGVNFAARASAPALFSVGLMDMTCPPSTVYAAYNAYAGDKRIDVYEYNNHEGGEVFQVLNKIRALKSLWG